ncbi:diguanylate cyclase [Desulfocurvus sp. DL9XJH121]
MSEENIFLQVLKRNEDIYRKFFEIETEILTILDFGALFERLVSLIKSKFNVDHAWIALLRDGDLASLLDKLDASGEVSDYLTLVDRADAAGALQECTGPLLMNSGLERLGFLMPEGLDPAPRSMALAPLTLDGRLVGCLVQADASSVRFTPDMDSTLLSQLAVKVSLCLSNVTAHERLARIASCDSLTGLANRRVMEERLHEEFLRAVRYGTPLSVAFVDMDDFKAVNDSLGHEAGDALLAYFAGRLKKMARKIDICARFAGDEFVVILPNTDLEQAQVFMQRVERFFTVSPVPGIDRHVCFSYGVACTADQEATSPEALLKAADTKLYECKACKNSLSSKAAGA